MKKLIILFIFIHFALFLGAQEKEYDLITDRPDATESSSTVPKYGLQIETGFLFEENSWSTDLEKTTTFNSSLFRIGLLENLELRLGFDYIANSLRRDAWDTTYLNKGINPPLIGTKIAISKQQRFMPEMALLGHFTLPRTGNKEPGRNGKGPAKFPTCPGFRVSPLS